MEKASEESRRVVGSMHGASFSQVWPKAAHDDMPVPGHGHHPGRSLPVHAGSHQVFLVLPTEGCKWYPTVLTFAFLIISLCEHLFQTFFFL